MAAQSVHRFRTHTIQSDTLLECLRVILSTRVEHRNCFNHLALWNASSIVTDRHSQVVLYVDFNALSCIHLELVDRVIHNLLEQHVDSILCMGTIAQTPNVHTWTSAHMIHIRQMSNILIGIFHRLLGYVQI